MRTIQLTIQDEQLIADSPVAGQAGEHLAAALALTIPEEWRDCTCTLRFCLPAAGQYYRSIPLKNPIEFPLPQALLVPGELQVFLDARTDFVVHRTSVLTLTVEESLDWCGSGTLVADRYEGLLDSSLQEFEDALGKLETLTNRLDEADAAVQSASESSRLAQTAAGEAKASSATAQDAAAKAKADADRAAETVAGFEGYTKGQSDTRYAHALTGTAEGTEIAVGGLEPEAPFVSLSLTGLCQQDTIPGTVSYCGDGGFIPLVVNGTTEKIPVELYGIPDETGGFTARDQLVVDYVQGTAYVQRNVGRIQFTGEEKLVSDLTAARETSNYFYLINYNPLAQGRMLCNLLPWRSNGMAQDQSYCWTSTVIVVTVLNAETGIIEGEPTNSYLEKLRAWLRTKAEEGTPLTLFYPLAEPRVEPVDEETKALLLSTALHGESAALSTEGAIHPYMHLAYCKNAQSAVDALAARAETAEQAIRDMEENGVTRYGVRFDGPANAGKTVTRLYNADGLVAGVGTDTETAVNDFDHVYPWSARRRCCGYFDDRGNFVVNAYDGEPGYATDGTNGEVWVEHSLFYYKHTYDGDAEEILISAFPIGGYLPAPIFVNPDGTLRQKAYTAAYPMATVDGKATSRSGVFPDICSLNTAMTTARTLGTDYTTTTTAEWYTECLYMWVEFATRDLQTIMMGASSMAYAATDTAIIAETGTNRIIVTNEVADRYVLGQTICIGTKRGESQVTQNRIVTAIEQHNANDKAIAFDGSPVDIAVGNTVWTAAWINGSCDGVLSSSGSPVSNTSGKYNCVYRGKESPYANGFEWISDVLCSRSGTGTDDDPYTYSAYYLPDPTKHVNGTITSEYIKLNYPLPQADGYVKKLGFDSRYPHLRLPTGIGAGATTYYSDNYYYPRVPVAAACVGGSYSFGLGSGPCFWYCSIDFGAARSFDHARLSHYNGCTHNSLLRRIEALEAQAVNQQIGG